ncbi:MAG TPA: hypothetical protein VLT13_06020, partial [Bacteroidota bacterium]|nr:hypothetical protein [Bacteroidota bacterium]
MKFALAIASLLVFLLCYRTVVAQSPEISRSDDTIAAESPLPAETFHLLRELSLARKAGDIPRVLEMEKVLFSEMPVPSGNAPPAVVPGNRQKPEEVTSPLWGNDVKVFNGAIYPGEGKRQICVCADTVGGIYLGLNRVLF